MVIDPRFDPARTRLKQDYATGATRKTITAMQARKPSRWEWLQAHPDPAMHHPCRVLNIRDRREMYLIDEELQEDTQMDVVSMLLVPTMTRQGGLFLWTIKLPDETGRVDTRGMSPQCPR